MEIAPVTPCVQPRNVINNVPVAFLLTDRTAEGLKKEQYLCVFLFLFW